MTKACFTSASALAVHFVHDVGHAAQRLSWMKTGSCAVAGNDVEIQALGQSPEMAVPFLGVHAADVDVHSGVPRALHNV